MDRPSVRVGVMSAPTIEFSFSGIYSTPGTAVVDGEQQARVSDSGLGVVWNGRTYSVLDFTPTSPEGDSFCLKGVTIGVGFHWQRREDQRFRGSLRLIARGGMLTAINILGVEEYLTSVISSEMSSHSSLPLLQAHAVISRRWLLAQIDRSLRGSAASEERMIETPSERIKWYDRSDHTDFDVCADDHCQRYQGISRISAGTAASAVADTLGQVLMAGQVMADTRFSKCCGGVTGRKIDPFGTRIVLQHVGLQRPESGTQRLRPRDARFLPLESGIHSGAACRLNPLTLGNRLRQNSESQGNRARKIGAHQPPGDPRNTAYNGHRQGT